MKKVPGEWELGYKNNFILMLIYPASMNNGKWSMRSMSAFIYKHIPVMKILVNPFNTMI